jgi:hypothetical protein
LIPLLKEAKNGDTIKVEKYGDFEFVRFDIGSVFLVSKENLNMLYDSQVYLRLVSESDLGKALFVSLMEMFAAIENDMVVIK